MDSGMRNLVKFSARVTGVGPASRPDGSLAVALTLGVPVAIPRPAANPDADKNVLHIKLPGQQAQHPAQENRLILFLTQAEWDTLEHKPVYGESFVFESTRDGFKIIREKVR